MRLIGLLLMTGTWASAQTSFWVRGVRDSMLIQTSYSLGLCADGQGSVLTCGKFYGRMDFDPLGGIFNLASGSNTEAGFVQKLDSNGILKWAVAFTGTGQAKVGMVAVDASNNVFVAGDYYGAIDRDPGPGTDPATVPSSGTRGFLVKLSSTGQYQWGIDFGTTGSSVVVHDVDVSLAGEILLTGYVNGPMDLDPGPGVVSPSVIGGSDVWMIRLNASGGFLWGKRIGSTGSDFGQTGRMDASGNAFIGGMYASTFDADPGPGTFNLNGTLDFDVFLTALDPAGNFLWAKRWGDYGEADRFFDLEVGADGSIYYSYGGPGFQDLDPGPGTASATAPNYPYDDGYMVKLSPTGGYVWHYGISGQQHDGVPSIGVDQEGNLYLGCYVSSLTDVDPGPGVLNLIDDFVVVLDSAGSVQDGFGVSPLYQFYDTDVTPWGVAYYTGGQAGANADFDPGPGVQDLGLQTEIFTWRWRGCTPKYGNITATACDSYTLNNVTYTQSGSHVQHLAASSGCDSILTLQLTLLGNSSGTTTATGCDSVTVNGITYSSSGVYTQTLMTSNGCDSILTVTASVGATTSGQISASGCDSVTVNSFTYSSSGSYSQFLTNSDGCDSVLTVQVTIHAATAGTTAVTGCEAATLNGMTYTVAGTYQQSLTNAFGCDSALTVQVTLVHFDTTVVDSGDSLVAQGQASSYQWYTCQPSFQAIPGAITAAIAPATAGSYAVVLSGQGCSDTSSCHSWTPVGMGTGFIAGIRLWPNPTNTAAQLTWPDASMPVDVEVFDALGRLVQASAGAQSGCVVAVPTAGVYLIRLRSGDARQWSGRLVRQ